MATVDTWKGEIFMGADVHRGVGMGKLIPQKFPGACNVRQGSVPEPYEQPAVVVTVLVDAVVGALHLRLL